MSTMPEREPSTSGPITIDRTSPVPLYFQLAQHFESAIRSGALKVGARLENEVRLAEMLGLSRPTVRAAFLYLANKGLVVRKRGAGTVAANERIDPKVAPTSRDDPLAAALLTMERIAYDQAGRPVEFARHLYRASRYAFTTSLPRPRHEPVGPA